MGVDLCKHTLNSTSPVRVKFSLRNLYLGTLLEREREREREREKKKKKKKKKKRRKKEKEQKKKEEKSLQHHRG